MNIHVNHPVVYRDYSVIYLKYRSFGVSNSCEHGNKHMALIWTSRQLQLKAEALLRQLSGRYLDLKVSELWRVVTHSGYLKNDSMAAKVQYAIGSTSVSLHQCIVGSIQSSGNMHCNKRVVTSIHRRRTYKAVAICIATSVSLHQCITGGHTKQWQFALQLA